VNLLGACICVGLQCAMLMNAPLLGDCYKKQRIMYRCQQCVCYLLLGVILVHRLWRTCVVDVEDG